MILQLCLSVGFALVVSAICSLFEAVLYSLRMSHIELAGRKHRRIGQILTALKKDIHRPITAILTLNTIANTTGAAIAGSAAASVFGEGSMFLFSAVFTVAILLFSEILPKTIGVSYCRSLAVWIAYPLHWLVWLLTPVVLAIQAITRLLPAKNAGVLVSAEEIQALATQGHRLGEISLQEQRVITNIIGLRGKNVRQIMTPASVTFMLDGSLSVQKAMEASKELTMHSRIPVYEKDRDAVVGIVLRRDLLASAANGKENMLVSELMHPPHFVPESGRLNSILLEFFEQRHHLFIVVDEYGSVTGVISLEDVIEEIVGREIVDESDQAMDMRELAKRKRIASFSRTKPPSIPMHSNQKMTER